MSQTRSMGLLTDSDTDSSDTDLSSGTAAGTTRVLSLQAAPGKSTLLLGACLFGVLLSSTALHGATLTFRLSPGPRLVGTRATNSGSGSIEATLDGSKLILHGSYHGLLAIPTGAHLFMGSLPGVRGPLVADLTITPTTSGTLSGAVELSPMQLTVLHIGGFYVEIDSDKAPDGDLWGWLYPFEQPKPSDRQ